jgi:hypothetical protein
MGHGSSGVAFALYKYALLLKKENNKDFKKVYGLL